MPDEKLFAEVETQANAFGVSWEAVMGRDRSRRASAARRAVWAALLTRHPGGKFPATVLAKLFERTPSIVRSGVKMHNDKTLSWPRRKPTHPVRAKLLRRRTSLQRQYRALKNGDPLRASIRAECNRITTQLRAMEFST